MSAMVRVVVRPDDVEGVPLGGKSAAGTVSITAEYDRTVELADGTIRYAGVRTPLRKSSILDFWQIDVIASDAADIVRGAGCCVTFRVEVTPRRGGGIGRGHGQAVTTHAKTIQVVTADGLVTNLAVKPSMVPVPEGAVMIDPITVTKAGEAWDKANNAENIATGAVAAAQAAQYAAEHLSLWVTALDLQAKDGATPGAINGVPCIIMGDGDYAYPRVGFWVAPPSNWEKFQISATVARTGGSGGTAVLALGWTVVTDGNPITATAVQTYMGATTGAQNATASVTSSTFDVPGSRVWVEIVRAAPSPEDTLAGDLAMIGVSVQRVS